MGGSLDGEFSVSLLLRFPDAYCGVNMALFLYNLLTLTVLIAGFPLIFPFLVTSRKRRKTVLQRLFLPFNRRARKFWSGEAGRKTVWVHALSLGEVVSAVPLVLELEKIFGKDKIVFSVSTLTGFETAESRLDPHVRRIFFFPYDILFSVARAVKLVDPELVIIVETDLWPNFMARMKLKEIPVVLANARLSDRSTTGYRRIKGLIKPLLNSFATICVQSVEDASRFRSLGTLPDRLQISGNLKFDQKINHLSDRECDKLRRGFNIMPNDRVMVAGSTHPGEEEILLKGYAKIKKSVSALKLVIAPRDPDRAPEVKEIFLSRGFTAACLAEIQKASGGQPVDIIVIDRIGLLGKVYTMGDLAFIGGSLVQAGGHNPLEPAAYGKPMLFGPDMSDFRLVSRLLVAAGAAAIITDADSLHLHAQKLLEDAEFARLAGRNARRVFDENSGAVGRTIEQILTVAGCAHA
jgi:3-deoxy-D-manno-octulosonic-acid transferase